MLSKSDSLKYSISTIFIISIILLFGTNCNAAVQKNIRIARDNLDAQALVTFGQHFNNALITLIGRVIGNYHMCAAWSEWSNWSQCATTLAGTFPSRNRTRRCGDKEVSYGHRDEIETGVCEETHGNKTKNMCPKSYHTTANGFCFRFYSDDSKNSLDAQEVCKNDGGYLVIIDSDQKYEDVKAMLLAHNVKTQIHINGRRVDSEWKTSIGSTIEYFHWYPAYPKSKENTDCLRLTGNYTTDLDRQFRTYNYDCNFALAAFICEVPL